MRQAGLQVLAQSRTKHYPHATCPRKHRIKFKTAFLNSVTSFQRDSGCARCSLQTEQVSYNIPDILVRSPSLGTKSTAPGTRPDTSACPGCRGAAQLAAEAGSCHRVFIVLRCPYTRAPEPPSCSIHHAA